LATGNWVRHAAPDGAVAFAYATGDDFLEAATAAHAASQEIRA